VHALAAIVLCRCSEHTSGPGAAGQQSGADEVVVVRGLRTPLIVDTVTLIVCGSVGLAGWRGEERLAWRRGG
jgi:hypothetical protein